MTGASRGRSLLVASIGALLWAGMSAAPGCASDPASGYAFASAHDAAIGGVAVPVFENLTFSHGLEAQLTEAVVKEIQRSTPWAIAPRDAAGAILTGQITGARLRPLSTARVSGLTEQAALEITVNFELRNARTGRIILSKRNFRAAGGFVPVQGVGERLDIGQAGAVDALARDIVAALRADW